MAEGHDGFVALKGQKFLVDDESGQMMSTLVRKYLLGPSNLDFLFVVIESFFSNNTNLP